MSISSETQPASQNHSFQIPDLLAIISSLELRTNRHCKFATDASEKWIREANILSETDLSMLRSTKIGLLVSLCFPTCDAPQLRVLANCATLLQYSGRKTQTTCQGDPQSAPDDVDNGVDGLRNHELLKYILDPQVLRLQTKAPKSWESRVKQSIQELHASEQRATLGDIPVIDDFVESRRMMYGINFILDLAELLEVCRLPELQGVPAEHLMELKARALDVIAWSLDVVSYHGRKSSYNLVEVLMHHKSLSLQGAMNLSGNMIKDAFASFCTLEHTLLESLDPKPILRWTWRTAPEEPPKPLLVESVKTYIQTLKDCIAGTIHWVYETELFFGTKGGEIRMFGWVFTDQSPALVG